MDKNILKHLNNYSYDIKDVNRLLVSSFLIVNNIKDLKNEFIKSYIISDKEETQELEHFISFFDNKTKLCYT